MAPGLELGTGVRYIGSSVGIGAVNADYTPIYGSAEVPAHTVWDAMIGYDFAKNWRAQLNVNNLLGETYVASCDYYCYYGEPRSVVGQHQLPLVIEVGWEPDSRPSFHPQLF